MGSSSEPACTPDTEASRRLAVIDPDASAASVASAASHQVMHAVKGVRLLSGLCYMCRRTWEEMYCNDDDDDDACTIQHLLNQGWAKVPLQGNE